MQRDGNRSRSAEAAPRARSGESRSDRSYSAPRSESRSGDVRGRVQRERRQEAAGEARGSDRGRLSERNDRGQSSGRSEAYGRNRSNDRNGSYDRNRGSYDRNRGGSYDRNRGGSYDRNRGSYNGGRYGNHRPQYYRGRVSRCEPWNNGYRVWVAGAPYPFFVPLTHWRRSPFRVGVVINIGGYYNDHGYYDYYDGPAEVDGTLRGTVESVDYRSGNFVLRNDATGSFVTVIERGRDRDLDRIRPGDYVVVDGDWNRRGVFEAYRLDFLDRY